MKEKIKNIFKNENLWSTIVEILCAVLLVCVGYFSGFSTGLLVDDSIRTEIIDNTLNDSKKSKIEPKKSLVNNESLTNVNTINKQVLAYTITTSSSRLITQDLELNLGYELGNFSTTFNLYFNFNYYISDIVGFGVSSPYRPNLNNIGSFSYVFNSDLQLASISLLEIVPIINFNAIEETISFDYQITIFNEFFVEFNYEIRGNSFDISKYISTTNTKLIYTENYISISSLNDFIDNYWIGYEDRKDSLQDTESKMNKVWVILEKAITSVLNILSMEILPGVPLYICVVVPVMLGLILWVVKMGGS